MSTVANAPVSWIPAGFHTLTPYLHPLPEHKLTDFLKAAFGAEQQFRTPPTGPIMHSQLRIGDSIVELAEPPLERPCPRATSFRIFFENVDEVYRRALQAGATSLAEPVDRPYGFREAGIQDPAGNYWFLSRALSGDSYKPAGVPDIEPSLIMRRPVELLEFFEKAFGAEVLGRHFGDDGILHYAAVKLGDSILSVGQARDRWQPMPGGIHYYIPNVDEVYQRALAAGAQSIESPVDKPYGDRSAGIIDPEGNYWYLTTHIKDVRL